MTTADQKINALVVHYDEIGLKGKNRGYFEKLLVNNIKAKTGPALGTYRRETGQLTFDLNPDADVEHLKDTLGRMPGVAYFAFARRVSLDLDRLKTEAVDFVKDIEYTTFKVDTRRHSKTLPKNSMEISAMIGEAILIANPDKKVKMTGQELTVKIEVTERFIYISAAKLAGMGGFPSDPRQKVAALLSGGFDSPVAAYLMMKRGCEVILVNFLNENQDSGAVKDKVVQLAAQLSKYQKHTKLLVIPFGRIQKEIIMKTPSPVRMVVYRRFMAEIAAEIARRQGAFFLVVGDSLSQVASQTIENLQTLYETAPMHIVSPLIGFDKKEIIDLARRIGTFGISSADCPDLCSYYLPKHPALRVSREALQEIMQNFDVPVFVREAIEGAIVHVWPETDKISARV